MMDRINTKKSFSMVISFLLIGTMLTALVSTDVIVTEVSASGGDFRGGDGTEGSPYIIEDVYDLQNMSADLGANYTLGDDINASETRSWNWNVDHYEGFEPIAMDMNNSEYAFQGTKFTGSFDGNGHSITNLFINRSSLDYVGLFGHHDSGNISNVSIDNCNIIGNNRVGGLVGHNHAPIRNCSVTGDVTGNDYVGGFTGRFQIPSGDDTPIRNSYAVVEVTGNQNVGGFVGYNPGGNIHDCYSAGAVSGNSNEGGFCGYSSGTITACFFDNQTSGQTTSGGGTGKNTTDMKTKSTFTDAGWDFADTWCIEGGVTYPQLRDMIFYKGNGTISNPYVITDVWELQNMIFYLGANYILGNDIDASATQSWNNGSGFVPIAHDTSSNPLFQGSKFTGSLDGKGYEIDDLYINRSNSDYLGLFGHTRSDASIRDVCLLNVDVNGDEYVGGLVGRNDGAVENSYATSNVSGYWKIGGLLGVNEGTVNNSYAAGNVSANKEVGGLVGRNDGTVNNSYATADVSGRDWYVGGLMGDNWGTVSNCYATGSVSGSDYYTGGLVGENHATINHSYATGNVNGTEYVGGLAGGSVSWSTTILISNSYATGNVSGINEIGGLVGRNNYGLVKTSYASGTVTGEDMIGGLVGRNQEHESTVTNSYATGNVSGNSDVGGLVGYNDYYATVNNSYAAGNVSGNQKVGGLVGWMNEGKVNNSYAAGNVIGNESVGGLIGKSDGRVSNSHSSGSVDGNSSNIGGLIGYSTAKVIDCYSTACVSGNGSTMGGLIGECEANVSRSYSTCDVSGNNTVGGLIGYISGGLTVNMSYSNGNVSGGNMVGGFIGKLNDSRLENVYAAGDVTGDWGVGGLVGHYDVSTQTGIIDSYCVGKVSGNERVGAMVGSDTGTPEVSLCFWDNKTSGVVNDTGYSGNVTGITGKNTTDMMNRLTFVYAPWDFNEVWAIKDGYTYPFFRWDYWNDAPLAFDDDFTVDEEDILDINAPGPLINDDDPDLHVWISDLSDDKIEVMDYESTSELGASVTMESNGSFTYDPTGVTVIEGLAAGEEIVDSFNYTITDKNGGADNATIFVTVKGDNDPPVANDDYNATTEDMILNVQAPGLLANDTDPDDSDVLTVLADYHITDHLAAVSISSNGSFVYDPTVSETIQELGAGDFIVDSFNYTLTDGNGGMGIGTVYINVSGLNDEPVITTIDDPTATEDTLYSVDYEAEDPDLDTLNWNIYTNASWLTINTTTGELIGTPSNGEVGSYWVNVTVEDGNGGRDWSNFTLTVDNTNDAPVIITTDDTTAVEDSLYSVDYDAADDDMDTLTWSLTTDAGWLSMDSNGWLNGTPSNDDVGSYWVDVSVIDGNGGMDTHNFTLTVENVNDAPVIITSPPQTVLEDEDYMVSFEATDEDPISTSYTWSLETNANWLMLSVNTVSGTPENSDVGSYWVNVSVDDGNGGSDSLNYSLTVMNVNDAPVITTQDDESAMEDVLYSVDYEATDEDLDTLVWDLTTDAGWLSMDPNGWLNGTPTNADVGSYWVNVSVDDGNGGNDHHNFTLVVSNVNDAPVISTTDDTTAVEDSLYSIDYEATDDDLDTLTWSLNTDASWLSMAPSTGVLSGTPSNSDVGNYWVNVSVSDGNGGTDCTNFTLVVSNTNDAPVITTEDETTATEDSLYSVDYDAADDDLDTLTWSLNTDAGWLSIDSNGWLNGTPINSDVGSYWVNVSVSDGKGGNDHRSFMLNVVDTNDAPVITTPNNDTAIEGERYTVVYSAEDKDRTQDTLTWHLDTNASWLSMDPDTGILSGKPLKGDTGNYSIDITVDDGRGGTDSTSFILNVLADTDGDGIPDDQDEDDDDDGTPDAEDDFPSDPTEQTDTDGDGVGDNADKDDDNDNWTDSIEELAGTDKLDASSKPKDKDSDGVADFMDTDDQEQGETTVETPTWAYISLLAAVILGILAFLLFMRSKKTEPSMNEEREEDPGVEESDEESEDAAEEDEVDT